MGYNPKRWVKPIGNRLPMPRVIVSGREVKVSFMERVNSLMRGSIIPKPIWYDAIMAHPPPMKLKGEKPVRLQWEEDKLRRTWLRRNPAATQFPKSLFLDPAHPMANREHPADTFVKQQIAHMRRGDTEEQAYRRVLQKQREQQEHDGRVRDAEVEEAKQHAAALGAIPAAVAEPLRYSGTEGPSTVAQQLLRRFAEEAKEAGQPYPKHWFDANGAWVGIGKTQETGLQGSTLKALSKTEADSDAVDSILDGSTVTETLRDAGDDLPPLRKGATSASPPSGDGTDR